MIMVSSLLLAIDEPKITPYQDSVIELSNYFFLTLFTIEFVIKSIVMGF